MRAIASSQSCRSWLPLVAAAALAWPCAARAQSFEADYGLAHPASATLDAQALAGLPSSLAGIRVGAALHAGADFSGAGLSLAAGRNWFAQVAVGRSLQQLPGLPAPHSAEAVRIGGGYRWSDGQSLSLQLTSGRGSDRLGLSVSYDWPRYFVRLSYDAGLNPAPQDRLRLSAGVRF
jgi:hypothetical protein